MYETSSRIPRVAANVLIEVGQGFVALSEVMRCHVVKLLSRIW